MKQKHRYQCFVTLCKKIMSKVYPVDDSEDDDIWEYQPRLKNKLSQVSKPKSAYSRQSQIKRSDKVQTKTESKKLKKDGSRKTSNAQPKTRKLTIKDRDTGQVGENKTSNIQTRSTSLQEQVQQPAVESVDEDENKADVKCDARTSVISKKTKTNNRKHVKTPKIKKEVSTVKEPEKREGFCPVCQMPYEALSRVQSPTWHIHECLETPYSSKKECPAGLDCDSTIPSHYKKFHHKQLARHRARLKAVKSESTFNTETKRKIEFDKQSEKENLSENELEHMHKLETDNAENIPDSQRDVDQMLMDALDDNINTVDSVNEDKHQSHVIQSNCNSSRYRSVNTANSPQMDCSLKLRCVADGISPNQVSANNRDCPVDNSPGAPDDAAQMENKTLLGQSVRHNDTSVSQNTPCEKKDEAVDQSVNTPCSKESTSGPSFFELSQSAQKLGFFAKKRRQRNQASTSLDTEEVPLKKARKSKGKADINCQNGKNRTKLNSCATSKNDISVDDKNNNFTVNNAKESGNKVSQQEVNIASVRDVAGENSTDTNLEVSVDPSGSLENELHIKIEDVRSQASDIFYGDNEGTFTENIDKPVGNDTDIRPVDDVSSDSMSSVPDIFGNDSEQCDTEVGLGQDFDVMDENPDLMVHRLGSGFIIDANLCDSQAKNSEFEGTADKDATLTNNDNGSELESVSEVDEENAHRTLVKSKTIGAADSANTTKHDSVTPQAKQTSESKSSPLMNAFHVLMQKGKSLSQKLLKKEAPTQTVKNAMDILMNNTGKHNMQKETKPKREWSTNIQGGADDKDSESGSYRDEGRNRSCPFYKKIPGTPFTVDAFRYGNIPDCKAYFLTHFHYDHYGGLTKKFSNPIYCSQITSNLVKMKIKTADRYIHTIALDSPVIIEGVEVTFLEANHCPGSVLILFRLKNGKVYLHTGDFRAHPKMEAYPSLVDLHVHTLYLDTTYCDPQYTFPPQEDVIAHAVQLALDARAANPKTLIVCGSYTIGKERIFTAIAEALNCKISVTRDKKNVLDCLDDPDLRARVSLNWQDSGLHVLPMAKLNLKGLGDHLRDQGQRYDCVLALEPTGWTCNKKFKSLAELKPKMKKDRITLYGVPYSEHSSYLEMKRFVQYIRPDKILPTVNNGNVHSRKKMEVILEEWNSEIKQGNR